MGSATKLKARVSCTYNDSKTSGAIAKALSPDNLKLPAGLLVKTRREGKKVITNIETDGKIETLIATLDDLLACTQTAEGVLSPRNSRKSRP